MKSLLLVFALCFSFPVFSQLPCERVSNPKDAIIKMLVEKHNIAGVDVTDEYFSVGRNKMYWKDVDAVYIQRKQGMGNLFKTYWVHVHNQYDAWLNFESKDEKIAESALWAFRCMSGICK